MAKCWKNYDVFFVSYFSSLNFCSISLECFCNFSTKLSFYVHFEDRKQQKLVCKKQKQIVVLYFADFRNTIISFCVVTFHFSFEVSVIMICPFFF
jgi:hypothetical protein